MQRLLNLVFSFQPILATNSVKNTNYLEYFNKILTTEDAEFTELDGVILKYARLQRVVNLILGLKPIFATNSPRNTNLFRKKLKLSGFKT